MYALAYPDKLFLPLGQDAKLFPVPAAMAVRKGDPDILNYFNNWILANKESGWLQERIDFWFRSDGWFGDVDKNPFARK
jgi:polar amino acid transport system substrate-binding protein